MLYKCLVYRARSSSFLYIMYSVHAFILYTLQTSQVHSLSNQPFVLFSLQAKAQQKASERAGVQSALKGATVGKVEREFEMYKQEMDAKLEQASTQ